MQHRVRIEMVDDASQYDFKKNFVVVLRLPEHLSEQDDWNFYIDNPMRGDRGLQIQRRNG